MSFLHPGLLLLLPLAVVPIILHLVTLHRLKTIELSTFRFLFDSYFRQHRRMKFAEALLTALRTLFLLFLVLLMGRPVMQHWSALFRTGSSGEKIVMIDCSASMGARTEGLSALDRAKSAALALVQRLSGRERLTLWRVTSQPEELLRSVSPAVGAVRETIEHLSPAPTRADLASVFKQIFPAGGRRDAVATVYLFTDCQASGWRQAYQQGLEQVLPPKTRLFVVDVGSRQAVPNRAVTGDSPPARAIAGLPVVLKPRVANYSKNENADVTVKLFINDHEVTRTTVALKPGEERVAEMNYLPREAGSLRGRFEIESDRFPEDDSFLFAMTVNPQVQVLLVNGKPNADPFETETLYLRAALTAGAGDETAQDFVRSLDVRELPEPAITADALRTANVVILANCGSLTDDQFGWLRGFVRDGGGLILFPGDLVKPDVYNKRFFSAPGPLKERLTPARLLDAAGNPKDTRTFARFTALDFHHPVLSVFDHPSAGYLGKVLMYRRFNLKAEETGATRTLAQFST
ncbi:MAG: BatA domain-containing protein, partial [Verrucomicrobia bacterium]|nr:BatA domain-containing protein [Verrucomicrobiota bacterium]